MSPVPPPRITFIGIGAIGLPMAFARCSANGSTPVTSNPASRSYSAMGRPMAPIPMKVIRGGGTGDMGAS